MAAASAIVAFVTRKATPGVPGPKNSPGRPFGSAWLFRKFCASHFCHGNRIDREFSFFPMKFKLEAISKQLLNDYFHLGDIGLPGGIGLYCQIVLLQNQANDAPPVICFAWMS